jgi:hypothetical protein
MRLFPCLSAALILSACGRASPQADALDNAATQADPAAAAAMRNEADQIRDTGNDAALADPNGAAQQAMSNAGQAAANGAEPAAKPAFGTRELVTPAPAPATSPPAKAGSDTRGAAPHHAGDPVPNTSTPTPVAHHY